VSNTADVHPEVQNLELKLSNGGELSGTSPNDFGTNVIPIRPN